MNKVQLLEQKVKESPSNYSAWYLLGQEYLVQEQLSQAFRAFSKAIKFSDDETKLKIINYLTRINQSLM